MNTMNTPVAEKTKTSRVARTFRPIVAAATGDGTLPTSIELLKIGMWDTPNHGMFMISPEDLDEYKSNFDAGIAQAGNSGIMIDYDHNKGIAAGWIKGLKVGVDAEGVPTLFADPVEWSGQGKRDLLEGNYKCISPEFFPASRGGWPDPENYDTVIPNVLAAAGLVNRPLFKGLQPIMASASSGEQDRGEKNIIYVSASEKENSMPTLEEVRAKSADSLTEEEQSFLAEHKAELNAEEQKKFGFEVTAETDEAKADREAAEAKAAEEKAAAEKAEADAAEAARATAPDLTNVEPVMAKAVKGDEGKVVMAASEVKELYAVKAAALQKEAEDFVDKHIARGAIVASERGTTVETLLSAGAQRKNIEQMIEKLPDNEVLAGEKGSTEKAGNAVSASEKLEKIAKDAVEASAKEGQTAVRFGDALVTARRENPDLAKQADEEARQ